MNMDHTQHTNEHESTTTIVKQSSCSAPTLNSNFLTWEIWLLTLFIRMQLIFRPISYNVVFHNNEPAQASNAK